MSRNTSCIHNIIGNTQWIDDIKSCSCCTSSSPIHLPPITHKRRRWVVQTLMTCVVPLHPALVRICAQTPCVLSSRWGVTGTTSRYSLLPTSLRAPAALHPAISTCYCFSPCSSSPLRASWLGFYATWWTSKWYLRMYYDVVFYASQWKVIKLVDVIEALMSKISYVQSAII